VPVDAGGVAGEEGFELMAAPAGGNAFHPIADGDLVPAQQRLCGGQKVITKPMAVKVLNDEDTAANPVHLGNDPAAFVLAEVMQEERAVSDIDARITKREGECVGGELR
jgi:hypothetical protein